MGTLTMAFAKQIGDVATHFRGIIRPFRHTPNPFFPCRPVVTAAPCGNLRSFISCCDLHHSGTSSRCEAAEMGSRNLEKLLQKSLPSNDGSLLYVMMGCWEWEIQTVCSLAARLCSWERIKATAVTSCRPNSHKPLQLLSQPQNPLVYHKYPICIHMLHMFIETWDQKLCWWRSTTMVSVSPPVVGPIYLGRLPPFTSYPVANCGDPSKHVLGVSCLRNPKNSTFFQVPGPFHPQVRRGWAPQVRPPKGWSARSWKQHSWDVSLPRSSSNFAGETLRSTWAMGNTHG
jgi:hypothetical protein